MKFLATFALLATSVLAGDFGKSCTDEHIDASTDILTANCDIGDGKGTMNSSSLDLNTCLGFSSNKIQVSFHPPTHPKKRRGLEHSHDPSRRPGRRPLHG